MATVGTVGAFGGLMSDTHGLHEAMKQEGWCFVAGTLIKTEEGNKAIEEIEVGDLVYARNTETGEEGYKEVVRLFPNSTQELIHVAVGDTVIDTTPAHRFWVEGKDFLPARDLQVGDRVLTASGELKEITSIERESLEEPVPVYNFEVKDWHTYYVSGEEILVHNAYGDAGYKVNQESGGLKFGENDLVYGPSKGGKLKALRDEAGGKLISDFGHPFDWGYDGWLPFSIDILESSVDSGATIHFDLTYMEGIDDVLNNVGQHRNTTTAGELRYIRDNWSRLSSNVKFYINKKEVLAPWLR